MRMTAPAAIAVLTAALTGAAVVALGSSIGHFYGAAVYVGIVIAALSSPAGIPAQVIGGQLLAGSVLLGPDQPNLLLLLPILAGIVFTAELLAVISRAAPPEEHATPRHLRRGIAAAGIGGGVYAAVVLLGELPGPTGPLAVTLAAAAFIVLAIQLVNSTRRT